MKKIYVILASAMFLSLGTMAQKVATPVSGLEIIKDEVKPLSYEKPNADFKNKAIETSWLSPVSMWQSQGAFWQSSSFMTLFQDSTVVINPTDGSDAFHQAWHVMGTVFEPTEPFYKEQTSTSWLMNRYDTYSVDSVRFAMGYFRDTDSMLVGGVMTEIIDTVIVHYYKAEDLSRWYIGTVGNWEDHVFTMPIGADYDPTNPGPSGNVFNDTILLDATANTPLSAEGTFQPVLVRSEIPADIKDVANNAQLNGANTVGMSITYRTMQEYSFGDTLANYNDNITVQNDLNRFGTLVYYNEGSDVVQDRYANNSFVTNRQMIAGDLFSNTFRGYLPSLGSMGWQQDFFFDADFLVSVENPANISKVSSLGINAYPNPASAGQEIIISVDENASVANVAIVMTDLLGNVINNEFTSLGNNKYSIATTELAGGVYLVNVKANNSAGTVRIVIAD
jgi:hypothetical protein